METQLDREVRGDRILTHYRDQIRPQLSDDDFGKFIAIDPESGVWDMSEDDVEAIARLRQKVDVEVPVVLQHPRIWVDRMGSGWPAIRD